MLSSVKNKTVRTRPRCENLGEHLVVFNLPGPREFSLQSNSGSAGSNRTRPSFRRERYPCAIEEIELYDSLTDTADKCMATRNDLSRGQLKLGGFAENRVRVSLSTPTDRDSAGWLARAHARNTSRSEFPGERRRKSRFCFVFVDSAYRRGRAGLRFMCQHIFKASLAIWP